MEMCEKEVNLKKNLKSDDGKTGIRNPVLLLLKRAVSEQKTEHEKRCGNRFLPFGIPVLHESLCQNLLQ